MAVGRCFEAHSVRPVQRGLADRVSVPVGTVEVFRA